MGTDSVSKATWLLRNNPAVSFPGWTGKRCGVGCGVGWLCSRRVYYLQWLRYLGSIVFSIRVADERPLVDSAAPPKSAMFGKRQLTYGPLTPQFASFSFKTLTNFVIVLAFHGIGFEILLCTFVMKFGSHVATCWYLNSVLSFPHFTLPAFSSLQ